MQEEHPRHRCSLGARSRHHPTYLVLHTIGPIAARFRPSIRRTTYSELSMSPFASMRVPCNGNQEQPSKLRQHSAAGLTKRNDTKSVRKVTT